ncbi:heme oxygenase [Croceivirga radicis]|uniref:Heme oxygenase n=1 Tax=Croceivirga radicis TaxID=1929488 RepID=A0A1V6LVD5_9FLAO|nr:DUF3050 domain-containing protein [Croceivirga radicis]OQD44142.1 heme oxygenase [Croceivirga radicis]
MTKAKEIELALAPLRETLNNHQLYSCLNTVTDVQLFMESHVYAVWDFMSLLKALQTKLTCTTLPWKPVVNNATARFINEIVLEEETDVNEKGEYKSHFSMYLDAMKEVGANTDNVLNFISNVKDLEDIGEQIQASYLNEAEKGFVGFTFDVIKTQKPHIIAAAFTFGREDVIPDMFLKIVEGAEKTGEGNYPKLTYYLKRHIELDGDEHGPLALKMIAELCGEDVVKWEEVLEYSKLALEKRVALWSSIANTIMLNKEQSTLV